MNDKVTILCTYILCFSLPDRSVKGYSMDDAKRLYADKKNGYHKTFRPITNQSKAIELYVGLELVSIQDFDEVKEQLTISAIVKTFWFDEYMTWDPNDYGGLDELVIESENVWTPNLVLLNTVYKLKKIGDAWQLIRFLSNGFAYYFPGDVFSASCRVDITYYPLDRHKCSFSFASWAQSEEEVSLTPLVDEVQTKYFSENGVWKFYNSSVEKETKKSSIDFFLYLERKPRFVLVNVILPITFMAFLNTIIFAIPVESGERISFSITVLLALAVFMTLVGDNLPKTSSPMSLFSYYLLVVICISIFITLETIFNVRLYYKDEKDSVPDWIVSFVKRLQCRCRNTTKKDKRIACNHNKQNTKTKIERQGEEMCGIIDRFSSSTDTMMTDFHQLSTEEVNNTMSNEGGIHQIKIVGHPDDNSSALKEEKNNEAVNDIIMSWKDVSLAFDKIFFFISFLVLSIATIVLFVSMTGRDIN